MVTFVMGATGAGKTDFLSKAENQIDAHVISVGTMLRDKYPPEYFEGSAAPEKTAAEAMEMCVKGIKQGGDKVILVDGQPRSLDQVHRFVKEYPEARYLLFNCPTEERLRRLTARDQGLALNLAKRRLEGDYITMFPIIAELLSFGKTITVFNSGPDDPRILMNYLKEGK